MRKGTVIFFAAIVITFACFAAYLLQRDAPERLHKGEQLRILESDLPLPEVKLVAPISIIKSGFDPDQHGYFQLTDVVGHEFRLINESAGEAYVEGHEGPGLRRFVPDDLFYRVYYTVLASCEDHEAKEYIDAVWPRRHERIRRTVSAFLAD